jgi:outer membrane protein OmpA-like peptidoglycan-associated protein
MADVTLAEFNGSVWLVGGEQYIDDLLANMLPPEISIELLLCEHNSEVHDLWVKLSGKQDLIGQPWIIHPGIVARIRRSALENSLHFAEWSAALDDNARDTIASVAEWAGQNPAGTLDIVTFLDPDGPQSIADLSRLRAQLVSEALVAAGVPAARIGRATRPVSDVADMAQESRRIDIATKPAED